MSKCRACGRAVDGAFCETCGHAADYEGPRLRTAVMSFPYCGGCGKSMSGRDMDQWMKTYRCPACEAAAIAAEAARRGFA